MTKQTSIFSRTILAGLLLSSSLIASTAIAQTDVGVNAAVKNEVTIVSPDNATVRQAVVKEKVFLGDTVNSSQAGVLQVLLKDQTVFTVGPGASMTIDEFVYDPSTAEGNLSASIKKGAFRFMSGKIASNPDNVKLNSPAAAMGVRGTVIEGLVGKGAADLAQSEGFVKKGMKVDKENALLVVLRGPGRDNQGINKRGEVDITTPSGTIRLDQPGQVAFVPAPGSPVQGPFPISPNAMNVFSSNLKTTPTSRVPTFNDKIGDILEASGGDTFIDKDTGSVFDLRETDLVEDINEANEIIEDDTGPNEPDFPGGPECSLNPQGTGCES